MTTTATATKTATIRVRRSCSGTVNIAEIRVGRRVIRETRAWGTQWDAIEDAKGWAAALGYSVKA